MNRPRNSKREVCDINLDYGPKLVEVVIRTLPHLNNSPWSSVPISQVQAFALIKPLNPMIARIQPFLIRIPAETCVDLRFCAVYGGATCYIETKRIKIVDVRVGGVWNGILLEEGVGCPVVLPILLTASITAFDGDRVTWRNSSM